MLLLGAAHKGQDHHTRLPKNTKDGVDTDKPMSWKLGFRNNNKNRSSYPYLVAFVSEGRTVSMFWQG